MAGLASELSVAVMGRRGIVEASLSRVWQHFNDRSFAILTSWRARDREEKEVPYAINRANFEELKGAVRAAGFGFVPLRGVGQEKRDGKFVRTKEPSLLIPALRPGPDDGSVYRLAVRLGRKYDQDLVVYHTIVDGEPVAKLIDPGAAPGTAKAVEPTLKRFRPDMISDYYTTLAKGSGRAFHLSPSGQMPKGVSENVEWVGLKFDDPPQNWIGGMALEQAGEIRPDLRETLPEWLSLFAT